MVTPKKTQAITPPAILDRLLHAAGEDVVLVGGQALGVWMFKYAIVLPNEVPAISNDSDFLATSASARAPVEAFAKAIGGRAVYPGRLALTAIVGQAELDLSDDEYINVDVIFQVIGLSADAVRARAVKVTSGGEIFLVMHPLHVLASRLANLHTLREKQNAKGELQLAMAINVAREFVRHSAHEGAVGRPLQNFVSEIEKLATEDSGRKVATRYKLHVADAIDPSLIPQGPFWEKKWPQLRELMSDQYATIFEELAAAYAATASRDLVPKG